MFKPTHLVQVHPPTPITAAAMAPTNWGALAVGSQFGFALIDLLAKNPKEAVAYYQVTHVSPSVVQPGADAEVTPGEIFIFLDFRVRFVELVKFIFCQAFCI